METSLTPIIKEAKVPQTVADQVAKSLTPFFAKVEEWKKTIQTIVITSPEETGKMKTAREARLALRQMRLAATEIVKSNRTIIKTRMEADVLEDKLWLKSGQVMEAEYKMLESQLEEKEKFAETWEANRKKKLHLDRAGELSVYGWQDLGLVNLGEMDDGSYAALLNGTKLQHEADLRAAQEAEKARQEEERLAKLEQSRRDYCQRHGITNYIPNYYTRKLSDLTRDEMIAVVSQANQAKAEYVENQKKIAEAKVEVASIQATSPQRKATDKEILLNFAERLRMTPLGGQLREPALGIFNEAIGYIEKVVARIKSQAEKL